MIQTSNLKSHNLTTCCQLLKLKTNFPPTKDRPVESSALEFFKQILQTPSPSGFESPLQDVVRQYVGRFADDVKTDLHGNVMAVQKPRSRCG